MRHGRAPALSRSPARTLRHPPSLSLPLARPQPRFEPLLLRRHYREQTVPLEPVTTPAIQGPRGLEPELPASRPFALQGPHERTRGRAGEASVGGGGPARSEPAILRGAKGDAGRGWVGGKRISRNVGREWRGRSWRQSARLGVDTEGLWLVIATCCCGW